MYVIIGLVLLLIVAPLFSILPSARQKTQMAMRKAAMAAGVSVQIAIIDDPNPRQDKYLSNTGKRIPARLSVAAYRIQRRRGNEWRALPKVDWCVHRKIADGPVGLPGEVVVQDPESRTWVWQTKPSELMSEALRVWLFDNIKTLPADVEQVEEMNYMITVYWHERHATDEQVVIDFLKTCNDLPLHTPIDDEV